MDNDENNPEIPGNGKNCFSYELRFTSYLSHIEVAKPSKLHWPTNRMTDRMADIQTDGQN